MDKSTDKKEKKGFFYTLGSVVKVVYAVIRGLIRVLSKTGLIIPGLYALAGCILYLAVGFNPVLFEESVYLESVLYAIGFGLATLACAIIFVKNIIVKPCKSFKQGFASTLAKKDENTEQGLPNITIEEPKQQQSELPKVYYSEMQKRLIKEYSNRFEVYIQKGSREILEKVEYKIDNQG